MFFYLSKLAWFVAAPSNLLVTLACIGCIGLATRLRRAARWCLVIGVAGLALAGASPLSRVLLRGLEDRFPIVAPGGPPVDGVIVLGGAVGMMRGEVRLSDGGSRMTSAVALSRRYPNATIVFTGGSGEPFGAGSDTEAKAARILFRSLGVPDDRAIYEDRSRNTRENALFTSALVSPKPGQRWLLITSAAHMPRSVGCFRAVGIKAEPYPVDFQTEGTPADFVLPFRNWSQGLRLTDMAVREWLGLVVYRLAGYTDELLPGAR